MAHSLVGGSGRGGGLGVDVVGYLCSAVWYGRRVLRRSSECSKKTRTIKVVELETKYLMLREYRHEWLGNGPDMSVLVVGSPLLDKYVSFSESGLTLRINYEWNGSNIVVDSPMCMKASAVHDAWCQGMRLGILASTEKNWDRGVDEYIAICRADGLNFVRSRLRELFMKLAGEFKFPG